MKTLTALIFWFLSQFGGQAPVAIDVEACQAQQRAAIEDTVDCIEPVKASDFGFAPASISNGF
jgi:hypothetical protein